MTTTEKTFFKFTAEQAAAYASGRGGSYPLPLYEHLLNYHQGARNLILDVGTGPGKVLFDLLPHFASGIGTDSSPGMIAQAQYDAAARGLADKARFLVYSGEESDKAVVPPDRADVITVAMAAHWIDMPTFYTAAARALRPGGTLAMWTCSSYYVHPSEANASLIQAALYDLEDGMLAPYRHAGNVLTRNAYDALPLPWTIEGFESAFEKASFERRDWDRGGVPSAAAQADGSPGPFLKHEEEKLVDLEAGLGSASMVVRWREANPDKALTDEDPVVITMKRLRELSGGRDRLVLSPSFSLLLMRTRGP